MSTFKGLVSKGIFILFACACASLVCALDTSSDSIPSILNNQQNLNTSTQCGETLDEENGVIWYNYPGPYLKNHRCVWVLRVENATGYNISILGFATPHNNSHQVSFTGFNHDNISDTEFYVLNEIGDFFQFHKSNIVVVTLQTMDNGDITTHGVVLSYNATFAETISKPAPASMDFHLNPDVDTESFDFPLNGTLSANQLTTFVFNPFNNTFDVERFTYATAQNKGNISDCDHVLLVYIYRNTGEWSNVQNSCDLEGGVQIAFPDLLLFIFSSNERSENANFTIGYSNGPLVLI